MWSRMDLAVVVQDGPCSCTQWSAEHSSLENIEPDGMGTEMQLPRQMILEKSNAECMMWAKDWPNGSQHLKNSKAGSTVGGRLDM